MQVALDFLRMMLWHVGHHVSLLVDLATLNHRMAPPNAFHSTVKRLGAVKHEQRRLIGGQAASAQLFQERSNDLCVLSGTLPNAQHSFVAVLRDSQGDNHHFTGVVNSIDHHGHKTDIAQITPRSRPASSRIEAAEARTKERLTLDFFTPNPVCATSTTSS